MALDTRIPMAVPNVLAMQSQVQQNNAQNANALAVGFQSINEGLKEPMRRNALALDNRNSELAQTQAEQQMLGQVLDGMARLPEGSDLQSAWMQAKRHLVGNGVFQEGELPDVFDNRIANELAVIASMPAEQLTDYERQIRDLNSDNPMRRQAAGVALGMIPGANAALAAETAGVTLRPGDVRLGRNNEVVAAIPAEPKEPKYAPGDVGELQAAINLGLVPPGTSITQFMEMKKPGGQRLPNTVELAQFAFPDDPAAQRQFVIDASKPAQTNVTTNLGGNESVFGKEAAKAMAGRYVGYLEGAESAQTSLNGFVEMRRLLSDPNIYTGWGAEYVLAGKKALQSLGVDVTGVASGENLVAQSSRAALDALADLKGVASDTDMRVVMNTAARISDTREGAIAKIAVAERAAQYRVAVANAAAKYVAENGEIDAGWLGVLHQMSAQFRDETLGMIRSSGTFAGYQGKDVEEIIDSMAAAGRTPAEIADFLKANGMLK